MAQPYLTVFQLASNQFDFMFPRVHFFNNLYVHGKAIKAWNRLTNHFVPPAHMIDSDAPMTAGVLLSASIVLAVVPTDGSFHS